MSINNTEEIIMVRYTIPIFKKYDEKTLNNIYHNLMCIDEEIDYFMEKIVKTVAYYIVKGSVEENIIYNFYFCGEIIIRIKSFNPIDNYNIIDINLMDDNLNLNTPEINDHVKNFKFIQFIN